MSCCPALSRTGSSVDDRAERLPPFSHQAAELHGFYGGKIIYLSVAPVSYFFSAALASPQASMAIAIAQAMDVIARISASSRHNFPFRAADDLDP